MIAHPDPIIVTYDRGDYPESRHRVHAAITRDGVVVESWGDVQTPVFPRSAFKPFQAMALLHSGAADAYKLQTHQLALAMSSHIGEARHVKGILGWLDDLELDEGALHCGAHRPLFQAAADDLVRAGLKPKPRHHMCSGKHAGMLTMMRHLALPDDYEDYNHPVQALIRTVSAQFFGHDPDDMPWGYDGCAVPNYAMPLTVFTLGYGRLLDPPVGFADHARRLLAAWAERPDLVAGAGFFDTAVMLASNSRILSKAGAEGIQAALIPDRGTAISLKAEDGGQRGAEQAMAALLGRLGVLDIRGTVFAKHWAQATCRLTNVRGDTIGQVSVTIP